ncbi:MAG: cation diffusion facilitator family transporter [Bacillota bacterium]|nr:cation diffusion facilitator family transporter [Bacillota bacterium]
MRSVTDVVLRAFVREPIDADNQATRATIGALEAWVSIVSNILLAAAKLGLGISLNSISLLADAVHTASDVVTSGIVLVGFRAARAPADEEHPYGHGRVETIATLVIAVVLIVVGFEFANTSTRRLFTAEVVGGSYAAAIALAASGLFKEWLARFSEDLGRRIDSSTLIADAWHHRSDAIASVLVAVAIVASRFGYPRVDAVFGILVSALIIYTGWALGKDASSVLIGRQADAALLERITGLAKSIPGVHDVHRLSMHDYGGGRTLVSLHIRVDERLRVRESHGIAEKVEALLRDGLGLQATVHIEPRAAGREEAGGFGVGASLNGTGQASGLGA